MIACAHCGLPVGRVRRRSEPDVAAPAFCCFGCRFAYALARPQRTPSARNSGAVESPHPPNTLLLRLGLGIFLAMNIMAFNWLFYSQEVLDFTGAHDPLTSLFAYLQMFLATVVVVTLGGPLLADALARRTLDAGTLIVIGVGAAYALSAIRTVRAYGSVYFDTAAVILVLVTLGNYLEAAAKLRATRAARDLVASAPTRAWVQRGDETIEVDAASLRVGERVRVRPGEAVPVDGQVADGRSHIDESSLTGESRLRSVAPGSRVLAGSINRDGQLWLTVTCAGSDRVIAQVQRLLEHARMHQPPIQRIADRVAAVFVPLVVLLAIGVFGHHAWQGDPAQGLFDALAVLLISCPCALGLAAPLATWSALNRAAHAGIVIDSAVTLEKASRVRRVFFDKTGTITDPAMTLSRIEPLDGVSEADALRWAASVESASVHPIARALVDAARRRGLAVPQPTDAIALPGLGVQANVEGRALRLGGDALLGRDAPSADLETTRVYLAEGDRVLARFELVETVRDDAQPMVSQLREMGMNLTVLTGDQPGPASRIARLLNVPVEAALMPADKLNRLERARQSGRVAMVGDGINDAPVLAAADVGIAVAGGTDLAKSAGNVHLLTDRLDRVPLVFAIARHAAGRIRLSLAWAFGYNLIGLTLAACGLLNPLFAASAMIASSVLVVHTSSGAGRVNAVQSPSPAADASLALAPA